MAAVGEAGADRFRPHFLAIEWDDMVDAFKSGAAVVNSGFWRLLGETVRSLLDRRPSGL